MPSVDSRTPTCSKEEQCFFLVFCLFVLECVILPVSHVQKSTISYLSRRLLYAFWKEHCSGGVYWVRLSLSLSLTHSPLLPPTLARSDLCFLSVYL